jgi:two-component system chemotaxis response regulator CheB
MTLSLTPPANPPPVQQDTVRIMVVDDSAVIRGLISRWIDAERDLSVVASVRTGRDAVNHVERAAPDVVVLDIEMPDLDGLSALPLLLAKRPQLTVIMASTLTRRNAEISFRAMALGAADYIPKPESTRDSGTAEMFRHELIGKIRSLAARKRRHGHGAAAAPTPAQPAAARIPAPVREATLRPFSLTRPRVLLIGASTGGPQALMRLAAEIGPVVDRVPVLITQHMPPMFTTILAEHLARVSQRPAAEGVDGEAIRAGRIYIAPGKSHMRVAARGAEVTIALDDGPPVNFCKPAVDPLFASAARIWQAATLAVVLTGMGADGMRGGRDIIAAGGSVMAQDEASSVVWGMPGAVAHDGQCAAVLPLDRIAGRLTQLYAGDRP